MHKLKASVVNKLLLASFIITQILFFIDEGYYDFRWMKEFGNWMVFIIYMGVLFGLQTLLFFLLRVFLKNNISLLTSVIAGTVVGIYFLVLLFS
jgi:putative effector of murein hydrolase